MIRKKLTICILTLALTVAACFTLLQAPKVFAADSPALGFSDSVEDPAYADTYATTWRQHHNCYAFALGRINLSYNKTTDADKFCEIGGYCGNIISADATTTERLNRIKQDLAYIKCTNVNVGTTMPSSLASDTTLICYREGTSHRNDFDYHFMRYDAQTGKWHHKPGTLGKAMIYNTQPSNDNVWKNTYKDGSATVTDTYDGQIYYITFKETIGFNPQIGANVIDKAELFEEMRTRPSEFWCLGNDIPLYDMSVHAPIENFTGILYGNGYKISKFKYNGPATEKIGIFGTLTGVVQDFKIDSSDITVTGTVNVVNSIDIGTIAAINDQGGINNCQVGVSKTYAPIIVNSNTIANVGGICGTNTGVISGCSVTALTCICTGNVGGICGYNQSQIGGGSVNGCEIHIYAGNAGGVAGYSDFTITNVEISGSNISCYNGFPSASASYYPSSHYGRAGGVVGFSDGGEIENCKLQSVTLSSANDSVDSSHGGRSFAPEIGYVCGRGYENKISGCTYNVSCKVTGNNLHTEKWGFWPWNYSWDQAQYVGARLVGHAL